MPRLNPFSLNRPERVKAKRQFSDSSQPGVTLELALQEPDALDYARSGQLAQEMIARYVDGANGVGPFSFSCAGEEYRLSVGFVQQVCPLVCMQPPAEELGYDPYTFEEMAAFAFTMPRAWPEILVWGRQILAGMDDSLPNAPGASTERFSEAPSHTDWGTRNSSSEMMPSPEALTTG